MPSYRPYNMDGRKASESEGRRRPVILIMLPLAVLLVLMACSVLSSQNTLDSQYRSLVAEQGLLSKQIALLATQAAQGSSDSFETMRLLGLAFERNLQELLTGIPDTRGLETAAQLDKTQRVSRRFREQTQMFGQGKDVIIRTRENIDAFNTDYTRMLNLTDAVATLMVSHGMSADQVYISTRQLLILERISKNLERMLAGGEDKYIIADRFGRDAALYGRVLNGLLHGDISLGIHRVSETGIVEKLKELENLFEASSTHIGLLLQDSPDVVQVTEATQDILYQSDRLLEALSGLDAAYQSEADFIARIFGD